MRTDRQGAAAGRPATSATISDGSRHEGVVVALPVAPAERRPAGPTLSVAQTAELLGVSRWLVQQAVRDGSLPHVRLGRRILIPRARVLAWLDGLG